MVWSSAGWLVSPLFGSHRAGCEPEPEPVASLLGSCADSMRALETTALMHQSLSVLQIDGLQPGESSRGEGVTMMLRGFTSTAQGGEISDAETAPWRRSHAQLVQAHGWSARCLDYEWNTVGAPEWMWTQWPSGVRVLKSLNLYPVPVFSALVAARAAALRVRGHGGRRSGRLAAGALGMDAALNVGRVWMQYLNTAYCSPQETERLTDVLRELRGEYGHVRVVAYSVGCRLLMEACQPLEACQRPDEIHLIAPAVVCDEGAALLSTGGGLARGNTHVYYTSEDVVLGPKIFGAAESGPALGMRGLEPGELNYSACRVSMHDTTSVPGIAHTMYNRLWGEVAYGGHNCVQAATGVAAFPQELHSIDWKEHLAKRMDSFE